MLKSLPLPTSLPWELQLVFWVLIVLITALLGLSAWFLLRHITQQDNQFKEVRDALGKQKTDFEGIKGHVVEATGRLALESQAIRKSALDFQTQVGNEIINLKKEMIHIEGVVGRTKDKAEQLEKKIDSNIVAVESLNKGIQNITKSVEQHQKTMSVGAKIFRHHKHEIDGIKTTIKKLSDGRFLVGEKRVPKTGSDEPS